MRCCFAYCEGDELVAMGSRQEISRLTGVSVPALCLYTRPSYQRKNPSGKACVNLGTLEDWEK